MDKSSSTRTCRGSTLRVSDHQSRMTITCWGRARHPSPPTSHRSSCLRRPNTCSTPNKTPHKTTQPPPPPPTPTALTAQTTTTPNRTTTRATTTTTTTKARASSPGAGRAATTATGRTMTWGTRTKRRTRKSTTGSISRGAGRLIRGMISWRICMILRRIAGGIGRVVMMMRVGGIEEW